MLASEIRQIAAHTEFLIVNDTAPPIRAAYPPLAVMPLKFRIPNYGKPSVVHLGDIDSTFCLDKANANTPATSQVPTLLHNQLEEIISDPVETVLTYEAIFGEITDDTSLSAITSEAALGDSTLSLADALNDLPDDVRVKLQDQCRRSVLEMNRSVI